MFAALNALRARGKDRRFRICRVERLESRDLLSAGPPTVVGVELSSSAWSAEFVELLQPPPLVSTGYAVPVGSLNQSIAVPWTNLDQIRIKFSEDVRVDSADLSVSGVNSINHAFSHFHYDPQAKTAVWTLDEAISKDRLRIDLNANGLTPIRDLDGSILDGEWVNNSDTYPSGNGAAGGDFEFNFNVLPADVNGSGSVEYADYSAVASLNGAVAGDPQYNFFYDLNGSGMIDSADAQEAQARYLSGHQLPNGLPAGTYNDAPTTKGFSLVKVSDAAIDTAIGLLPRFSDLESGASGLTYSIVSNSAMSLFDFAYIDNSTDKLVVNAASGASGRAVLTIQAMDSGGLTTESPITIDVNYINVAPLLYDVLGLRQDGTDIWIITGYVSDPDDDVSKFIVDFYGVFRARAAVNEFGKFEFSVIVEQEDWGDEFALAMDPHGYLSNQFEFEIGLT